MTLRISKRLRVAGYVLVALGIAGFALRVLLEVLSGNSLGTYRSGTLVQWTYSGALIVLIVMALLGIVGLIAKLYERWWG